MDFHRGVLKSIHELNACVQMFTLRTCVFSQPVLQALQVIKLCNIVSPDNANCKQNVNDFLQQFFKKEDFLDTLIVQRLMTFYISFLK